jgi:hypothetical protein
MISLIAFRNIVYRPWRSALLFFGFGIGVAVMIVLLSVGEALLTQARDEKLVGGGAITVLPQGLDVEVMKTGGIGGLYFSIDQGRFVYDQLLASPRLASSVSAVAPQIDGRLIYLRTMSGREYAVRASGEIPGRTRAVRGPLSLAAGRWADDDGDRRWISPTLEELRHEIDHFHLPSGATANRESWAEWHYFNVLSSDRKRWAFISFIVAGDVTSQKWGGNVAITLRDEEADSRKFESFVPRSGVRFSTASANLRIGSSSVTVLPDGNYRVLANAAGPVGPVRIDLTVSPAARAYFPGASLGSEGFVSGYTVPALRASATGSICVASKCDRYDDVQAYHDHNWGVWRGVTWDWGASRAGSYTLLYGRVIGPDARGRESPLFVYLVDSLGFRAVMRPARISYVDGRTTVVNGRTIRVPSHALFVDVRGDDTLRVELDIEDAIATDTRRNSGTATPFGDREAERGDPVRGSGFGRPWFVQMKGIASVSGRIGGEVIQGKGTGFFETYR